MAPTILKTPLHAEHVRLGGRMVPFGGYELPVHYQSVIGESKAVREGAGMFDVSHMARLRFEGERTREFLDYVTANSVAKLTNGLGHYSLLPNERGGTVDDIIVYRLTGHEFAMVVNAANHAKDVAWLRTQNTYGVTLYDETEQTAMIAVQGPRAASLVGNLSNARESIEDAPMFGVVQCEIAGVSCFAPRSGYTGEDGFELICRADQAPRLWRAIYDVGVMPCGLGARDVLRVEAGLPLYGHELTDDLSPIAAGLGWVIAKDKAFIGSEFINRARAEGTPTKLQGVRLVSKRLLEPGMKVYAGGGEVGEVSSGVYSPMLECSVAFAFLRPEIELGTACEVDVRGRREPGTVVNKRFFKRASR
ncbi:MAG: glycine cleavage system aminomethyltransferase GcvT [Fimbriimonas ginsengisoli]|uniref:aminomethyltransferase n=1 Tax=Fimbriimonas ginsengisoli TaxID=1005039 RepID=A0A931LVX2_FIMGI|nr:glycine cleavage system aminomethyltransferase GcvT [Fimbriimonas ginsengisoli]